MIKEEWKSLFHNKLLLIVLAAIIAIPTIYAGFFLDSMWDPYGNIDKLPVAVVNEDRSVEYEGKKLQVGADMVEELRENDALQFNFVDAQTASDGLRNGTYYMVVTIPEDFSENATTLMDENPQKMQLRYETNPGTNYIASKMSETALLKIKNSVCEEVTKTYAETVFDKIGEAGTGMEEAADGAGELKDGIQEASDGNKKITDNLKTLAASTVTFVDGAKDLQSGVKEYTSGVAELNSKVPDLVNGVSELNSGAVKLASGAQVLDKGTRAYVSGASILADGTAAYVTGAGQIAEGAAKLGALEEGLGSVYYGIKQLSDASSVDNYDGQGSPCLVSGTKSLQSGLEQIYGQVSALEGTVSDEGLKKLAAGLNNARQGMLSGAEGMKAASETIASASDGIDKGREILKGAVAGLNGEAAMANAELIAQVNEANSKIESANYQISGVNTEIEDMNDQIDRSNFQLDATYDEINTQADAAIEVLESMQMDWGVDFSDQIESLNTLKDSSPDHLDKLSFIGMAEEIDEIKGIPEIKLNASVEPAINAVTDGLGRASAGLLAGSGNLADGAKELQNGASQIPSNMGDNPIGMLKTALKSAVDGTQKVNSGTVQISAGLATLEKATSAFPDAGTGIAALNQGFSTLTANNKKLTDGASQLKKQGTNLTAGSKQLFQGTDQLLAGIKTLSSGTDRLSAGVEQLTANNGKLNNGTAKLSDGAVQIQDGAGKLRDGSKELGQGMKKLSDGSWELRDALSEGADEVKESTAENSNIEMFAMPVDDEETMVTTVENNGHAMAPYMMSVGLWVGCLAFCLIYPLMQYKGRLKSGFAWWASKASVLYPVAVLQGLLLILLLHSIIGFTPAQMGKTAAFACLTAVTFTSIMYFFNITLGKVGSFVMLIFMVIQLAGSAGTYPVEISPAFVAKIHWYLPFTYTVNSFRSTIAGGESIRNAVFVMTALFVVFTLLTIGAFQIKTARRREGKWILFDWLEERGLA